MYFVVNSEFHLICDTFLWLLRSTASLCDANTGCEYIQLVNNSSYLSSTPKLTKPFIPCYFSFDNWQLCILCHLAFKDICVYFMGPLKLVTKYTGPALKAEQAGVTLDRTLHLGMSLGRGAGQGVGGSDWSGSSPEPSQQWKGPEQGRSLAEHLLSEACRAFVPRHHSREKQRE